MQRPVKQVLLIAANSWTEGLVNEAVDEIRDGRILGHDYQLVPVGSLTEALDLIERAAFDVILLDPFVPDYRPMDAFLELRAATQEFPIVLLCGKDDEPLAIRALQEGAQDYLIVEEIDCLPFARALRSAMERFSAAQAANPVNFYDPVTGFYNKEGFLLLAGYMLRHARAQSSSAGLLLLDMPDDCLTKRNREFNILRLLDLSELIRGALGETDIAGRLSATQFAA